MSIKHTALILLCFIICQPLFSQQKLWGVANRFEKKLTQTPLDLEAEAVIIQDYGEISLRYFPVKFKHYRRIKILKAQGKSWANIAIPFSSYQGDPIKIKKAITLNINDKGKIEKQYVKKEDIYYVDIGGGITEVRFTFPNVQVGSIIEFEYLKTTEDVVGLQKWYFQNSIPVLQSKLYAEVDRYLNFVVVTNGDRLEKKYHDKSTRTWELKNLPPIIDEPYCKSTKEHAEYIQFQLTQITHQRDDTKFAGVETENVFSDWKSFSKILLEYEPLKNIYFQNDTTLQLAYELTQNTSTTLDKVKKIFYHVQQNYEWTNSFSPIPSQGFHDFYTDKIANSGTINLFLGNLLNAAEIKAKPIILSTQSHGFVNKSQPLLSDYNHIIIQVLVDGKELLLDASHPNTPYNVLPEEDLNYVGLLLDKTNPKWVDIPFPKKNKVITVTSVSFEDDKMNTKIDLSFFDLQAIKVRNLLAEQEDQTEEIEKLLLDNYLNSDSQIDKITFKNRTNLEKPITITCHLSQEIDKDESFQYLDPWLYFLFEKNPFNNPNRVYPVNFGSPFSQQHIFNLKIPAGFEIDDIPEPTQFMTEDQKASFKYQVKKSSNRLILNFDYEMNNPLFITKKYLMLREFFVQLIKKRSEVITLKKTN